jgi:hypothetical protein
MKDIDTNLRIAFAFSSIRNSAILRHWFILKAIEELFFYFSIRQLGVGIFD